MCHLLQLGNSVELLQGEIIIIYIECTCLEESLPLHSTHSSTHIRQRRVTCTQTVQYKWQKQSVLAVTAAVFALARNVASLSIYINKHCTRGWVLYDIHHHTHKHVYKGWVLIVLFTVHCVCMCEKEREYVCVCAYLCVHTSIYIKNYAITYMYT